MRIVLYLILKSFAPLLLFTCALNVSFWHGSLIPPKGMNKSFSSKWTWFYIAYSCNSYDSQHFCIFKLIFALFLIKILKIRHPPQKAYKLTCLVMLSSSCMTLSIPYCLPNTRIIAKFQMRSRESMPHTTKPRFGN